MGHDVGVYPWPGTHRPSLEEVKKALNDICREFEERFGFKARSLCMHGVIWAGWAESAKDMADNGLRWILALLQDGIIRRDSSAEAASPSNS